MLMQKEESLSDVRFGTFIGPFQGEGTVSMAVKGLIIKAQ